MRIQNVTTGNYNRQQVFGNGFRSLAGGLSLLGLVGTASCDRSDLLPTDKQASELAHPTRNYIVDAGLAKADAGEVKTVTFLAKSDTGFDAKPLGTADAGTAEVKPSSVNIIDGGVDTQSVKTGVIDAGVTETPTLKKLVLDDFKEAGLLPEDATAFPNKIDCSMKNPENPYASTRKIETKISDSQSKVVYSGVNYNQEGAIMGRYNIVYEMDQNMNAIRHEISINCLGEEELSTMRTNLVIPDNGFWDIWPNVGIKKIAPNEAAYFMLDGTMFNGIQECTIDGKPVAVNGLGQKLKTLVDRFGKVIFEDGKAGVSLGNGKVAIIDLLEQGAKTLA